ncbi:MAG: PLP-dependent aspartate aminotransferase family protein [Deltaproteobacteria bacterium]|nr:PLP-dependent aspartate aminotransferase family protein [Deltaproteobacteria bacterium]
MYGKIRVALSTQLQEIRDQGLYKDERVISGPQGVEITVETGEEVLKFCANNYLGLSSHPKVIEAAHRALDEWGYGMSSVRFICGTQSIHKELERKTSEFLGMDDLEAKLTEARDAQYRLIATDGVFSMDGDIAKLDVICDLAEEHDSLVLVDDSHATGFMGKTGRGTHEYCGVMGRVDLITTTFGKALSGASGGCTAGRQELIELLRQRSRPYLFSNTLPPAVVGATIAVFDLLAETTELRDRLEENTRYFRDEMAKRGFDIRPGVHPIVPIMLYDAKLAQDMAAQLLGEGIYVIGFSYPVVPKGQARIRVQISAAHTRAHLDMAIGAFERVGKRLGVVK